MPDRTHSLSALLVLLAVGLGAGCTHTAMLPARQLAAGETVASLGVDAPGLGVLPRGHGQLTVGTGGGDVSVNVGASAYLDVGVAGRYYLHEGLTAEAQLRTMVGFEAPLSPVTGIVGLQGVPTDDHPFYFGGHVGGVSGSDLRFSPPDEEETRVTYPIVGASVGFGRVDLGNDWHLQVEAAGNIPLGAPDDAPLPPARLSVGVFHSFR